MDDRRWLCFIARLVQDSAYSPPRGETTYVNSPRQNRGLLFLMGELEQLTKFKEIYCILTLLKVC